MLDCVIIGAGQTGRGFLAALLEENDAEITFIDQNKELIEDLQQRGEYRISYYENQKEDQVITDYKAMHTDEAEAVDRLAQADLVLTCVGGDHIKDLVSLFKEAEEKRAKNQPLNIICCENGVNVKQPLSPPLQHAQISEAVIFCTSLAVEESLDIMSQYYPDLPYDSLNGSFNVELTRFTPEDHFHDLIQRKIYTYNCLSAVVSYLGFYKGYHNYAKAANDEDVEYAIKELLANLNLAISKEFNVPLEEQEEFAHFAIKKFKNHAIVDTIERNCRDAGRKLGKNERLCKPLELLEKYDLNGSVLVVVIASALYYGKEKEQLDPREVIAREEFSVYKDEVIKFLSLLDNQLSLSEVLKVFTD